MTTSSQPKNKFVSVYFRGRQAPNYQKRNNRYYLRTWDPEQKKTVRIPMPEITTDEEAYNAGTAIQEVATESRPKSKRPTFAEFWENEYEPLAKVNLSPRTYESYEQSYRLRLKKAFGHKKINKITEAEITVFITKMKTSTYVKGKYQKRVGVFAKQTVYNTQTALSAILTAAVEAKHRPSNPVHSLTDNQRAHQPKPKEVTRDKVYTPAEIEQLLGSARFRKELRIEVMFLVAADTGGRISEICGLQPHDINWERGSITLKRQLLKDSAEKTGPLKWREDGDSRTVYPRPETMKALRAYVDTLPGKGAWSTWLFPTRTGKATTQGYVNRRLAFHLDQVGIKRPMDFHCFRHTFVSYLADKGFGAGKIGRLIGDSPDVVQKVYTQFINEDKFAEETRAALAAAHG